ncbi:helix-turn-helix domain-containing protein [Butyrivibrio sp. MC2013]|uniref:helix-turn-helix domain-containing protein n=1 Tax=Butyrivibrio sp. MC2013 TaxID=1280686 RepID=UPI0003F91DCD|nr:helix-turn-helix transcriptional regulator [Butyrivibrio sp. MC2013]
MGRASIKANKTLYQLKREELGLTREAASDLLEVISDDRIEKIENEKVLPHPDEILIMADKYKAPELKNYFCTHHCELGRKSVPEIKMKDLAQITLEMLASLNLATKDKDRLIEITADGKVDDDEIKDFAKIQITLEQTVIAAESLKLWSEQMIANGMIDEKKLRYYMEHKDQ